MGFLKNFLCLASVLSTVGCNRKHSILVDSTFDVYLVLSCHLVLLSSQLTLLLELFVLMGVLVHVLVFLIYSGLFHLR